MVDELPSAGLENVIYLVPKTGEDGNVFDEFMWINGDWEKIGDTATKIDIQAITNEELEELFNS